MVGRLNLALYGTRDAAKLWQERVAKHLISIGFRRGRSNPCVYTHKKRNLRTLVHGDDYATVGSLEGLRWLQKELEAAFEIETVIAGHSNNEGVVREAKILNRIIRAVPAGWEYESDQRHAEIILEELQMGEGTRPLGTPGVEETLKRKPEEEAAGLKPLDPRSATKYRALVARANYVAQDRAEIQYAVKELCRCMSAPNQDSWAKLKRLGRYLLGRPRAVSAYNWQRATDVLDIYSDANWGGCKLSRNSTSGGTALWGSCCLKSYSKTQGTIAQSSAESELIAIVKAACEALGTVSLAEDFGLKLRVRLHVDAAAALGILERQGVGRVRHLDIGMLWLQESQLRRMVELTKVWGTSNPADLMTKHVAIDLVDKYSQQLGYSFR